MKLKFFSFCLALSSMFMYAGCGTKDTPTPAMDYSPLTANSTWTYQTTASGTYTLTSTSRDTSISGKTFHVFTNSNGGNNYMGKSGNDYYRFGILPGIAPNGFDENYLKDNVDVNGTWSITQNATAPGIPTPIPVNLTYTIAEKGVQRAVSGKTYDNVVHVKLNIAALGIQGGNGNFYYSAGVGLIESTLVIIANPVFGILPNNQTQTLTSYSIK